MSAEYSGCGKRIATVALATLLLVASRSYANVNLEWRPIDQHVTIDDPVRFGLYAVSDSDQDQLVAAFDVVFTWDPDVMQLVGVDNGDRDAFSFSGFLRDDPYNLNETIPPRDGDGFYTAWARLGEPVAVTPDGILVTIFEFVALTPITDTRLVIEEQGGDPPGRSVVWDGERPNHDITGTLGFGNTAIIENPPCEVIADHQLRYRRHSRLVVSKFRLDDTGAGWLVTCRIAGGDGAVSGSRTTRKRSKRRIKLPAQGLGLHTAVIAEIQDPDGNIICSGAYALREVDASP